MKKSLLLLVVPVILFSGCRKHYYKVSPDAMSIYLKKPDAASVLFLSSLDGYRTHAAKKIDNKTWEVTLPPSSGFSYFYIVDGEVYVPPCRFKENDDFGSENCVFSPGL